MGCSSSVITPTEGHTKANDIKTISPIRDKQNGHAKVTQNNADIFTKKKIPDIDKNSNKITALDQKPVPKSVAFEITLDGQSVDGLFRKLPPKRLQTLEPLNLPKLTAEQLSEKQRLADEKRERLKEKKINTSQKSSKRRRELLKAKEFSMKQQMEQEKSVIDDQLKQAELKREMKLLEIKEKQRLREERAKRARERAKNIQNNTNTEEVEMEKDEDFNAGESDDSWLGNPGDNNEEMEEEAGLKKQVRQVRPTVSASTVDSYDAAFMRKNNQTERQLINQNDDDFFGS
ncbi:unnamed protein product [Lymnaea stagnalis]|uniref:Stathmin domain-containing protein 1 n=1 Tax=Lymnaea stagnalis TaxID=6523 RepID=A0AAV2HDI0_LYMST